MLNPLEKIRKLLALAESPNENEAALAAEKATEMMAKHGIEMAQVAAAGGSEAVGAEATKLAVKLDPWRKRLAYAVARSMGGKTVNKKLDHTKDGEVFFYGPTGTTEAMVALYEYLAAQVVALSAVATTKREETWIHGRTYRATYCIGMVARIGERLTERREALEAEAQVENPNTSMALVVVRTAVDNLMKESHPNLRKSLTRVDMQSPAYWKGHGHGGNVGLGDRQVRTTQRALGAGS